MMETTNRQIEGLLEAVLIIHEKSESEHEFEEAIRRIQSTIEKGATPADQDKR